VPRLARRDFLLASLASAGSSSLTAAEGLRPILVSVNVMFDLGAHSGKGLDAAEIALFHAYQERARREYAASAIHFDVQIELGAYLRQQGYSEVPDKFLVPKMINVFVTDTLGYDIDRDRTGGCSVGPRPRTKTSAPEPFYQTFLGLKDSNGATLPHEYAHHFCLDTKEHRTLAGNLWADLRNDYWLARQRHGVCIPAFRACANSEWARFEDTSEPLRK